MDNWIHARTVIEEDRVQKAVDKYAKQFVRFEDAFGALKWLIARGAENLKAKSREVDSTIYHLYRQAGDVLAKTPDITVLYTANVNEVTIVGIRAEIAKPDSEPE